MADTADNLQQTGLLVHEIGQLKAGVFIGLAVLVVFAMAIVVLWLIIRHREKTREQIAAEVQEEAKDRRAAKHADALDGLASTIREHIVSGAESMSLLQNTIGGIVVGVSSIEATLQTMRRQIEHIIEKQDGKLTQEQSLALVESFFFSVIVEKSFGLIALSLMQNNYEQRKVFIQEKIKTDISRILMDVRAALKSLPLTIRPEHFFVRTGGESERFVFCDLLWKAVEPLYQLHATPVGERISELRYKILNTAKDYYEDCLPNAASTSGTRPIVNKKVPTEVHRKHPSSASIRPL